MKKVFLKSLLLLCALIVGSNVVWGTQVTWPATTAIPTSATAVAGDANVKIKTSSSNSYTSPLRIYANTTITITVADGYKIQSVTYTASSTGNYVTYAQNATVSPNVTPSVNSKDVKWTMPDNTSTFTFKPSDQTRSNGITIVYSSTTAPSVSSNPSSAEEFSYVVGNGPSEDQLFNITGSNLSSNITVAVSSDYEVTDNTNYASSVTVSSGDIVSVRLKGNLSAGTHNGTLTLSSTGATNVVINLTGIVHKESHTATFSINGNTSRTATIEEDKKISFPTASNSPSNASEFPMHLNGKKFMGWYGSTYSSETAPTYINTASTNMGTSDVTYYAVYASVNPGTILATDEMTLSTTGISAGSTSYSAWSNKVLDSEAKYAGQSAGGNSAIQLRATDPSGIVSTTSGGYIKKVTLTWNSNTPKDRKMYVYAKNAAYVSGASLYSNAAGELLDSIICGTSTEYVIDGNYQYVGIRSKSGAIYLDKVTFSWGEADTYSSFCTTIPPVTVTIGSTGWATFSCTSSLNFQGSDVTAYQIFEDAGEIALDEVTNVPANTGILLHAEAGEHDIQVIESADELPDNKLVATTGESVAGGEGIYVLANQSYGLGFYKLTSAIVIPSGKAYLDISGAAQAPSRFLLEDEINNATDIKSIDAKESVMKFIENGRILILRDGIIYDALGRIVR